MITSVTPWRSIWWNCESEESIHAYSFSERVASEPSEYDREKHFTGCAISLKGYRANFLYTDEKHFIRGEDNFLDIEDHIRKFDMKGEPR